MDRDALKKGIGNVLNPYTSTTQDSPEYKKLICGRKDHLTEVLSYIVDKQSIILFGERGSGKTSFLYILKDIINGNIIEYKQKLIDIKLQESIQDLMDMIPNTKVLYLNLRMLSEFKNQSNPLLQLIIKELEKTGLLSLLKKSSTRSELTLLPNASSLPELFDAINKLLEEDRLVVLMDEMSFLKFEDRSQTLNNLQGVAESCHRIYFVFSGTEIWYKQPGEISPHPIHNVKELYLGVPNRSSVEKYLVKEILSARLTPSSDYSIDDIVQVVLEWTEGKPYYLQQVCSTLFKLAKDGQLPKAWKTIAQNEAQRATRPALEDFYDSSKLDALSLKILTLLAHQSELKAEKIANLLQVSKQEVSNKLDALVSLNKISEKDNKYRIVGTLIERWGRDNVKPLSLSNQWPQVARWAAFIILLSSAIYVYFYTHPPQQTLSFSFPKGVVTLRLPSSLEQNENGEVEISVRNTSSTKIGFVNVFLISSDIDYHLGGTNRISFSAIDPEETKSQNPTFVSHSSVINRTFTSQVLIMQDNNKLAVSYSFTISERWLPIKEYWGLWSFLLSASSVFFAGRNLWPFITNLFSPGFLRAQDTNQ